MANVTNYSTYATVGGSETFHKLANSFYNRVSDDPLLRPLYPSSMEHAANQLALFLIQFFGGPGDYSAANGEPRLRMRHAQFHIGKAERDSWLGHMLFAIDEVGIAEPSRTVMRRYFVDVSEFLINS